MKAIGMYIFTGSQTIGHLQTGWEVDKILEMTDEMKEENAYHFIKNFPNIDVVLPSIWNNNEYLDNLKNKYDLLFSNNPCSGLSAINRNASVDNGHNKRFYEVFEVIKHIEPKMFLIENAPTTVSKGLQILKDMSNLLNEKYYLTIITDKAGNHNVAMDRRRTLIVGFNRKVFEKHPIIEQSDVKEMNIEECFKNININTYNTEFVKEHEQDLKDFYKFIKKGNSLYRTFASNIGLINEVNDEKTRNVLENFSKRFNEKGNVWDKSAWRLDESKKAGSITSVTRYIHPIEDRDLYVREYARLMGYPDDFKFYQEECKTPVVQCIAQGVPVNFIKYISKQLMNIINSTNTKKYEQDYDVVYINQSNPNNISVNKMNKEEFMNCNKITDKI